MTQRPLKVWCGVPDGKHRVLVAAVTHKRALELLNVTKGLPHISANTLRQFFGRVQAGRAELQIATTEGVWMRRVDAGEYALAEARATT